MASHFRFFDLPGELRNKIYAVYIDDYQPEIIGLIGSRVRAPAPPLSNVCREIRHDFSSLWTGVQINTSQVGTLKAMVFDFHFRDVQQFLIEHENDLVHSLQDVQIRLVMTRASTAMSSNAIRQAFDYLRLWEQLRHPHQYAWVKHEWLASVPTRYTAALDPVDLKFEGKRFANRLFSTNDEGLQPMQVAVRDALRQRSETAPSSAL